MDIRIDYNGDFYKEKKNIIKSIPVMTESVNISLKDNMAFEAEVGGHKMMVSLVGCTKSSMKITNEIIIER